MRRLDADVLVIGSGPGGATTAAHLVAAGRDVLLVEEGEDVPLDAAPPYSLAEIRKKWRGAGLTPAFGPPTLTYVEGRCYGGASEINAALYHPPVPETLDDWARRGVEDFGADELAPHVQWVEREVGVAPFPGGPGLASERLAAGARALGWKSREVARFWRYDRGAGPRGRRQSMSETLLPRARGAGLRVETGLRVKRLRLEDGRAVAAEARRGREAVELRFRDVFVCAGALQTALLLRRSGLGRGVGDTLTMNPMIRILARFGEVVNEPWRGVPVEQVEEFKPAMTLGCSHSSPPHLALWLPGSAAARERELADWPQLCIYYAKVSAKARGLVRNVPLVDQALVRYALGEDDVALLGDALVRLGQVVFAAGAKEVLNPVAGGAPIRDLAGMEALRPAIRSGAIQLSAIHLHSTVPMGGADRPADSHGKLRAARNVWVNDASLLPESPGINPQGLILALCRRNVLRYLGA